MVGMRHRARTVLSVDWIPNALASGRRNDVAKTIFETGTVGTAQSEPIGRVHVCHHGTRVFLKNVEPCEMQWHELKLLLVTSLTEFQQFSTKKCFENLKRSLRILGIPGKCPTFGKNFENLQHFGRSLRNFVIPRKTLIF